MQLEKTRFQDLFILNTELHEDSRGGFHSLYDFDYFKSEGISFVPKQSAISSNTYKATLRGMHYQVSPSQQTKLIRCLSGAMYDVVIDLRERSHTFCDWYGIELFENDCKALLVPPGFAHGFITLSNETNVLYELTCREDISNSRGIRWNDQNFSIVWPLEPLIISDRDSAWPNFINDLQIS